MKLADKLLNLACEASNPDPRTQSQNKKLVDLRAKRRRDREEASREKQVQRRIQKKRDALKKSDQIVTTKSQIARDQPNRFKKPISSR